MSDINFLQSDDEKKEEEQKKKDGHDKQEIEWSKPSGQMENKNDKSAWSNIIHKKEKAANGMVDKSKLKNSRQEILKLIKEQEKGKRFKDFKKPKQSNGSVLATWLKALFSKKKPQEVFFDLEKVFKEEKNKRTNFTTTSAKPEISGAPQIDKVAPEPPKSYQPAPKIKPVKIPKPNRFAIFVKSLTSGLKKFWQNSSGYKLKMFNNLKVKKENKQPIKSIERKPELPVAKKAEQVVAKEEEKKWESSNIIETNLIKGEVVNFFDWRKKIIIFSSAIIFSCLFLAASYMGLIYWQKQKQEQIAPLLAKIENIRKDITIAETNKNELFAFQKKIKIAKALLDKHIYWTNFFKFLEDYTLPEVYYNNFSGDTSGHYILDARTSNYDNIAKQIMVLKKVEIISQAQSEGGQILGQGKAGNEVQFDLELLVDKKIFTP